MSFEERNEAIFYKLIVGQANRRQRCVHFMEHTFDSYVLNVREDLFEMKNPY